MALCGGPAAAAKLARATVEAFEQYARQIEQRMESELRDGSRFLWIDGRRDLETQVRNGRTVVEERKPRETKIPDGMIHHWVASAFVPGVSLEQTLELMTDYDSYEEVFKPMIAGSRLLRREGNLAQIHLRIYIKKTLTAVFDTEHEVRAAALEGKRWHSRTVSTRILEVEDNGKPGERRLPEGDDRGFLWRYRSYWRFAERDGGTYVQCEALGLSREAPMGLGWIVGAALRGGQKDFAQHMVSRARETLAARRGQNRN
jgi:hypothetical protein